MKKLCASMFVVIACMTGGCMNPNLGVGVSVSDCCQPGLYAYRSYGITIRNSPEFLKPYMLDGMSQALLDKGLIRDDENHDLLVTLTYQQTDLKEELQKEERRGEAEDRRAPREDGGE